MKISQYPQITNAETDDVTVISGVAGDRQITVENLLLHRPITSTDPTRMVTLSIEGWSSSFRQVVTVQGMRPNSVFLWDVAFHTAREEYLRFIRSGVRAVAQGTGQVTFQAFFSRPDTPIPIIIWLMS